MTGYGVGDGPVAGGRLQIEIRTVNHRHFNAQVRAPLALQGLEGAVRDRLRSRIERGHINVGMRWIEEPPQSHGVIHVDMDRARALLEAVEEMRGALNLAGTVDLGFLARQPGVLRDEGAEDAPGIDEGEVFAVLDGAIEQLQAMRAQEGTALARDLTHRLDCLSEALEVIRARAPERLTQERDRLRVAVRELMDGKEPDPDRLAQEIALTAARLDIAEEIVRLETHIRAAREILGGTVPGGRRLGFLGQEMLREINTIGSKANDAAIGQAVIGMKEELERFREQLENVE
jgi:uncharacterized protein (TIGR00255 family)